MNSSASTSRTSKSAGLIGLGFMFVWGCALLFWIDLANEYATWKKVVGTAGAALVSLSCLALALYTSRQERRAAELERQLAAEREASAMLRNQVRA